MNKCIALLLGMLLLICCTSCTAADVTEGQRMPDMTKEMDVTFTERELAGEWDVQKAITVTGSGNTFKTNGRGIKLSGGQARITADGVYVLTGEFTMPIVIAAGSSDKVQLVLQNAAITTADGPAILIESADKVFITLPEGSVSHVTDGAAYASTESGAPDAAIFSRADLCLNGAGSLLVTGQYRHGIVSKDDLVIVRCTLEVSAASTGLDGKDCLKATEASITIHAGTNGMRSDNAEDAARGFIYLDRCRIVLESGGDGIQTQTSLMLSGGELTITSGGGSGRSLRNAEGSWKGLKAAGDLLIEKDAVIFISSRDDCIHANGSVLITGGSLDLSSGDDGVHADSSLTISGGELIIRQSYEGLEASKLTISGGNISITASDDGLNAAGGADGSAAGNRFGRGFFSNGVGEIIISGGYTVINASGDGIDSNSTIAVSGGVTLVSGPTNSMNAAFDYDGSATVTGGILIATGPAGMAQNFSDAQGQGAILVSFSNRVSASLALVNTEGNIVAAFTPQTAYQSAVFTAPGIQDGQTYAIVVGGQFSAADANGFAQDGVYTGGNTAGIITMDGLIYGVGHSFGPGGGGPGGGGRPGGGWGR